VPTPGSKGRGGGEDTQIGEWLKGAGCLGVGGDGLRDGKRGKGEKQNLETRNPKLQQGVLETKWERGSGSEGATSVY
jgi:hypothetical protein